MKMEETTDNVKNPSRNLPWVEKYRPKQLEDLISHEDIISTIRKFIHENRLPHLLFYGPPGTGKTSTVLACARELYTPHQFNSMVLELNASDDRGIGVVRGQILSFASTRSIFKSGFKLIILDEADAMTNDAQNALRRIIEKFTDNVRFCLICNYMSKITPAIQSRCTRFRFGPLKPEQILPRMNYVIEQEKVNITEDGRQALLNLAQGDMRRVLNIMQSTSMAFDVVNEDNVYTCVGHPLKSDIANAVTWMLNEEFTTAYSKIRDLQVLKGLALQDILTEVHLFVHRSKFLRLAQLERSINAIRIAVDFPPNVRITLLDKMADVEHRLAAGSSERLQLGALLSVFNAARGLVAKQVA